MNCGENLVPSVRCMTSFTRSMTMSCPSPVKYPGAPGEALAGLRDPDLGFGDRLAHGVEVDVPVAVDAGDAGDLGLPVDLLQVHPHRVVELEDVGPEGRTAGGGGAEPEGPERFFKGRDPEVVRQPVLQYEKGTRILLSEDGIRILVPDGESPVVHRPLGPGA